MRQRVCKNKFDVSESSIGKSYTCPKCGNNFLSFCEIPQNAVSFTCTYCHKQQTIPKEKALRNNGGIISCAYCKEIYSGNKFSLIKIPLKPSRSSKRTSQPATTHSVNHQSVPSPSGSISYSRDPGIYILLALLFGGLGAHNLYAKENSKFVFKLIMSCLTLVCSIAAIANQPSVEYNRYTYSVTTHVRCNKSHCDFRRHYKRRCKLQRSFMKYLIYARISERGSSNNGETSIDIQLEYCRHCIG